MLVEFRILGPIGLYADSGDDAAAIALGQTKVRGVLGILAYKAGKTVGHELLADGLWDENRPPNTRKTLQVYTSRLRHQLKEANAPATIHHADDGYRMDVDPERIDYHRFLAHSRRGQAALGRSEFAVASASLAAAVKLWRGTPLSTLRTVWAQNTREALTAGDLLPVYNALFDAKRELGDHDFVVSGLRPLMTEHPHDEMLAGQWMRALAADRRTAEIPAFFLTFTRRLATDMATRPSEKLVQLYRDLTAPRAQAQASAAPRPKRVGIQDLPRTTPAFTGRAELLAPLDELTGTPIVAIDGPPGAGKTTLVTHWARTRLDRFPDGVLYADLQGYAPNQPEDPAIVMSTFLTALGVAAKHVPPGTEERVALLRHLLSERDMLVFIDNVRDSAHVQPLLAAVSPCPVVVTSRQQLTKLVYSEGATRLTVGALSHDAATELLAKRIGTRCTDSPSAVAALVSICARLPMALKIVSEHIAARAAAPIEELVEDLRNAGRLLDAGPHGDDLTTSLRTAFSWSYHALSANAAHLFHRLGLHPTPRFSTGAAAAVAGLSREHTHRALDDLIGAHLIQQDRAERYFLHDVVHAYAVDLAAAAPDRVIALRRMVDWYLRSAANARKALVPDLHPVPALLPPEKTSPLTFDTAAHALRWFLTERSTLITIAHLAARHGLHEHVWRLAACLEGLADRLDGPHQQVEIFRLGHDSAAKVGNRRAAAGNLNNLGKALLQSHRLDEAQQCFEWALPIFLEEGDRLGAAVTRHNLGVINFERGNPRLAITVYEEVMDEVVALRNEWAEAHVHHKLGDSWQAMGRHDDAARCYQLALALRTKINDVRGQGVTLTALAQLNAAMGNVDAAIAHCEASLKVHRQTADQINTADAYRTLAEVLLEQSPDQAIKHAGAAVAIYRDLNPHRHARALAVLADAYSRTGELANARDSWNLVHRTLVALDDPGAADARLRVEQITSAMSGIPGQRPNAPEIVGTQESS
nr:transcriptional regulator, SARP family [Kibdelosporangium sp. MJ126-NF4]